MRPVLTAPTTWITPLSSALLLTTLACSGGDGPGYEGVVTPTTPWSEPSSLETWHSTSAFDPVLAVDYNGSVIAAWNGKASTTSDTAIWANHYTVSQSWSGALPVESLTGSAQGQKIAMNGNGLATLVWEQGTGTRSIQSFRYSPSGSGFTQATEPVSQGTGDAMTPSIAIDEYGNAMAAWVQSDGSHYHVWASRYTSLNGWGSIYQLDDNDTEEARNPVVAMDPEGNAVVAWEQSSDLSTGPYSVMVCNYKTTTGWDSQPTNLQSGYDAWRPAVAMSNAGIQVAWQSTADGGDTVQIYTSRYTTLQGWGSPRLLSDPEAQAASAAVALDSAGNCIVTWRQLSGLNSYAAMANHYSTSGGWENAASFDYGLSGASVPVVSMNSYGKAVVAWCQDDGVYSTLYAARYLNGWEDPYLVSSGYQDQAFSPAVAVGSYGDTWAAWVQYESSSYHVMASTYVE